MGGKPKSTNATICECGAMCFAPASSWGMIFVDAEDARFLREYVWSQNATYRHRAQYAVSPTFARQNDASRYLHLAVLGIQQQNVDYKNHNGLDNRRDNLRICTGAEISQRRRKSHLHRGTNPRSSHYKGVHKYRRKWAAYITAEGKKIWLGRFGFESDAAVSYNYHAAHYFGGFAFINNLSGIKCMHD